MLLQWKDEYSVSIEAVDCEHKQLIELINRLHDQLGTRGAKLTVPAFPGDLLKGISAHFALEERVYASFQNTRRRASSNDWSASVLKASVTRGTVRKQRTEIRPML